MRLGDQFARLQLGAAIFLLVFIVVQRSAAQEASVPSSGDAPAGADALGPTEPPSLTELERAVASQLQAVDEDYHQEWVAVQRDRLKAYQRLLEQAVSEKRTDEAAELREKVAAVEAEMAAVAVGRANAVRTADLAAFRRLLDNTTWQWNVNEPLKLQSDGKCSCDNWTSRKLVTTWRVIDHRTVLLYIQSGRNENRYAILAFDPSAEYFTVYGFEGSPYDPRHKVFRVKKRS